MTPIYLSSFLFLISVCLIVYVSFKTSELTNKEEIQKNAKLMIVLIVAALLSVIHLYILSFEYLSTALKNIL